MTRESDPSTADDDTAGEPAGDKTDTLAAAVARHNLALPDDQLELLDEYCHALWEWNTKINLTRHTDYEKFVARDLVDSLALAELLEPDWRVLDVGTGGGVPGVVLAIIRPDLDVVLVESVGKKARVVTDIVEQLGLPTVVHHDRAEKVVAREKFDALLVRAVAPLERLLTWFEPYWSNIGRLLVIKGPAWVAERHAARERGLLNRLELRRVAAYPLHEDSTESVVLSISPKKKK